MNNVMEEYSEGDIYEDEEETESALYDDEVDFEELFEEEQSLMDNARVRLEQGRLYEMLIKHDLFDGVDALPEAISNVQNELKNFIMERLEILLGMKSEKEEVRHVIQESQFNDLEVQVLRRVASKFSKGMTENAPATTSEPPPLNTVKKKKTGNGLKSLNSKPSKPKPKNKIGGGGPLKKKPANKAERSRKRIKKEMANTSVDNMTVDAAAKKDLKYIESLKNMSLEEANEVVSQRHARPQPKKQLSQDAINSHYQTRAAIDNTKINDYTKVLRMVAMQKAQEKE
jgi:hypothetical protein